MYEKHDIKLFLLSGKAGSGKDTTASFIEKYYKDSKVISLSLAHYLKEYAKRITNWDGSEKDKPRTLLQTLGIELIKENIDPKLLIRRLIEDIEVYSYFYDVILVTDVRLKDELIDLKEKYPESISIRVKRDNVEKMSKEQEQHLTEVDLDGCKDFDYIINNDGSLEDLYNKIESILGEI